MIVTLSDFQTGKYELHTGMYDQDRIQNYIDLYESKYIKELLGVTLGEEFIADYQAGLLNPNFVIIFDPLSFDYNRRIYISEGMKAMLVGFLYWEIVRDYFNQMTPVGNVIPTGENSMRSTSLSSTMWDRYNEAVRNYRAIQFYVVRNAADYDCFNGQHKLYSTWL